MQVLAAVPAAAPALRARLAQLGGCPAAWWTPEVDIALLGGLQRCGLTAGAEALRADKQLLAACWGQVGSCGGRALRSCGCGGPPDDGMRPARPARCRRPPAGLPRGPCTAVASPRWQQGTTTPPRPLCSPPLQAVATGAEALAPANPTQPPGGWPSADVLAGRCKLAVEMLAEAVAAAAAAGPFVMRAAGALPEGPGGGGPPAPPCGVLADAVPDAVRWSKKDRQEMIKAVMVGGGRGGGRGRCCALPRGLGRRRGLAPGSKLATGVPAAAAARRCAAFLAAVAAALWGGQRAHRSAPAPWPAAARRRCGACPARAAT
jgi:hypothetical protein